MYGRLASIGSVCNRFLNEQRVPTDKVMGIAACRLLMLKAIVKNTHTTQAYTLSVYDTTASAITVVSNNLVCI